MISFFKVGLSAGSDSRKRPVWLNEGVLEPAGAASRHSSVIGIPAPAKKPKRAKKSIVLSSTSSSKCLAERFYVLTAGRVLVLTLVGCSGLLGSVFVISAVSGSFAAET